MKNFLYSFFILFLSCKESTQHTDQDIKPENYGQQTKIKYGKKFFDYNELEYYRIDKEDDENEEYERISDLYKNQHTSKIDAIKHGIIVGEIPSDINDKEFLSHMQEIGYSKKKIDSSNFEKLNKIFVEKPEEDMSVAACIPVFRDILIFKKNSKIKGMVKICFSCHQYRILGTDANTEFFGSDTDYIQLQHILSKN